MQKYQVVLNFSGFRFGDTPTLDPNDPVTDAGVKSGAFVPVPAPFDPSAAPTEESESDSGSENEPQVEGEGEVQVEGAIEVPPTTDGLMADSTEPEMAEDSEEKPKPPAHKATAKPRGGAAKRA